MNTHETPVFVQRATIVMDDGQVIRTPSSWDASIGAWARLHDGLAEQKGEPRMQTLSEGGDQ